MALSRELGVMKFKGDGKEGGHLTQRLQSPDLDLKKYQDAQTCKSDGKDEDEQEAFDVDVYTLDYLHNKLGEFKALKEGSDIFVMKIDVESHEYDVLVGSRGL